MEEKQSEMKLGAAMSFGVLGGLLLYVLHFPLPWLLGAFTFSFLWKMLYRREFTAPAAFKTSAFILLGVYFALYISVDTITAAVPILPVYLPLSLIIIAASILAGLVFSKQQEINKKTGILSSIPGAQSAVIMISDKHHGSTAYIMLLHSTRRVLVLMSLPLLVLLFGAGDASSESAEILRQDDPDGYYFWYLLPLASLFAGLIHKNLFLTAPIVTMALLVLFSVQPAPYPELFLAAAQLLLGTYLGAKLRGGDIKQGGMQIFVFAVYAMLLIFFSTLAGLLLSVLTPLDTISAVMSLTPGGLMEMGIAASESGGDPAKVIALQLFRFLIVFYCLPPVLHWYFQKQEPAGY
jgi:uncharacterized protein